MIHALAIASSLLAAAALGWGFASAREWLFAAGFILPSLVWLVAELRGWTWFSYAAVVILTAGAVVGILLPLDPIWFVLAVFFTLIAWDLWAFARRLQSAANTDDKAHLQRRHLSWLAIAAGLGILLSLATFVVRLQISFGWGIALAVLVVVALSRVVTWLKNHPV